MRTTLFLAVATSIAYVWIGGLLTSPALAQEFRPFGVSASSSSFKNHEAWFPKMKEAGVTTVRLFPEWNGFESATGTLDWKNGDLLIKTAKQHQLEINAILMGSPPGSKATHAFPMERLDDWSAFVSKVVDRYKADVHHWEVWNEGNGGFNDGKHTTSDYAKLATTTYDAVKSADTNAKVGLTVASFDAPYLHQAMLAMAKQGKPNCFDYLCIHPYEIADGLENHDGEIPFLWMSHFLRTSLREAAPQKADVPIWITEVGHRLETRAGRTITENDAAESLVKIYTMAMAQGISCTQWFEAQDPVGEDQGFGLLQRDGQPRQSYRALKQLATLLGPSPKYLGWLGLAETGRGYGFVFQGKESPVLVAWMPKGRTFHFLKFTSDVTIQSAIDEKQLTVKAGEKIQLTDVPLFITSVPKQLVDQAQANAKRPFPWGGDHSKATSVFCHLGPTDECKGVFPVGRDKFPTITFPDNSTGVLLQGDISHPVSFFVHPTFANFSTKEYYVRVTVRRVAAGNVGMNLLYEVADSQGKSAYANVEQWYGVSEGMGWQTHTWHVKEACFSKIWGHDFTIRAEQSVPFVLGKVEVSTEPFR